MAIPPRGDPRRPLHLAIRSCRAVGGLFIVFGIGPLLLVFANPRRNGVPAAANVIGAIIASTSQFAIATAFYVLALFLKKRQLWAVITALVLASLMFLVLFVGFLALWSAVSGMPRELEIILLAIAGLVLFKAGRLIYQLARSFDAIRHLPEAEARGFDPIFPPTPSTGATSAPHQPD